jgi:hypothetical protein
MVIGTLWKVRDSVCLDLALQLYEWISANGLSAESVAEGFHNICRSLRAEWVTKEQRYRESRSNKHRSSERPFSSDVEDDDEDVDDGGRRGTRPSTTRLGSLCIIWKLIGRNKRLLIEADRG